MLRRFKLGRDEQTDRIKSVKKLETCDKNSQNSLIWREAPLNRFDQNVAWWVTGDDMWRKRGVNRPKRQNLYITISY